MFVIIKVDLLNLGKFQGGGANATWTIKLPPDRRASSIPGAGCYYKALSMMNNQGKEPNKLFVKYSL